MTAFNLAVMARREWTDQLMLDTKFSKSLFKRSFLIFFTWRELVSELKIRITLMISLYQFYSCVILFMRDGLLSADEFCVITLF